MYSFAVFQDFGDGVGGSIYQQQLNVVVRYLSESNASYLNEIEETHAISDILDQMEIEYFEMWKDASARLKWQKIRSVNHLGADISIAIQNLLRSEIEARERDWAVRETEIRRVLTREMEIALAAEREAYERERQARDAEIPERNAVNKSLRIYRESDIRREERQPLTCRQDSLEAELHPEERKANENPEAHGKEMLHASWAVLPEATRAIRSRVARLFKF